MTLPRKNKKATKTELRLQARISDYEKITDKNGFRRPGSLKK